MSTKIYGHSGSTVTTLSTVTHTAQQLQGPPAHGGQAMGIYILQDRSSNTYRWMEDVALLASATVPTTFSAL